MYSDPMPKLWTETVEAHRHEVRHAVMHTTLELVSERGLRSVTMSEIAEKAGIGRATLYKYFPDVESILHAWHHGHITAHLQRLREVRDKATGEIDKLSSVLEAHALHIYDTREHRETELAALIHRDDNITHARQQLTDFITDLIAKAAAANGVRKDTPPRELAGYCLHAIGATEHLSSKAAVHRLLSITLDALRTSDG